jgi:hypothetical protein
MFTFSALNLYVVVENLPEAGLEALSYMCPNVPEYGSEQMFGEVYLHHASPHGAIEAVVERTQIQ